MHQSIRGISFTIRKQEEGGKTRAIQAKQLGDFLLGHFITFQVTFGSTFDCLHNRETNTPNFFLPAGSVNKTEYGRRGFPARLFRLD